MTARVALLRRRSTSGAPRKLDRFRDGADPSGADVAVVPQQISIARQGDGIRSCTPTLYHLSLVRKHWLRRMHRDPDGYRAR
jgi:hypothetical protein